MSPGCGRLPCRGDGRLAPNRSALVGRASKLVGRPGPSDPPRGLFPARTERRGPEASPRPPRLAGVQVEHVVLGVVSAWSKCSDPTSRAFPRADDGTRTHDLLHGKRPGWGCGKGHNPHGYRGFGFFAVPASSGRMAPVYGRFREGLGAYAHSIVRRGLDGVESLAGASERTRRRSRRLRVHVAAATWPRRLPPFGGCPWVSRALDGRYARPSEMLFVASRSGSGPAPTRCGLGMQATERLRRCGRSSV
jgi:hypothetical protein